MFKNQLKWNSADENDANQIFKEYTLKISSNEEINWKEFELKLRDRFECKHQTVSIIVNGFYDTNSYIDVCYQYAKRYPRSEFNLLIKDFEEKNI